MQFYHGIYAIAEKGLKVVSLDPHDVGLTRAQLKKRLLGLIDFSMTSPSIPLIEERSRLRPVMAATGTGAAAEASLDASRQSETAYACTPSGATTTRTIRVANGDGTFHQETVTSTQRIPGSLFKPDCVGLPLTEPLIYGGYSFLNGGLDTLTGRVGNDLYHMRSYLDAPPL